MATVLVAADDHVPRATVATSAHPVPCLHTGRAWADLRRAAFRNRGGKGDHQNREHPQVAQTVGLAGKDGDDALPYQERAVRDALEELGRTQKGVQP